MHRYIIYRVDGPGTISTAGKMKADNVEKALGAFFDRRKINDSDDRRRHFARRDSERTARRPAQPPVTITVALSAPERRAFATHIRQIGEDAPQPLRRALSKLEASGLHG